MHRDSTTRTPCSSEHRSSFDSKGLKDRSQLEGVRRHRTLKLLQFLLVHISETKDDVYCKGKSPHGSVDDLRIEGSTLDEVSDHTTNRTK